MPDERHVSDLDVEALPITGMPGVLIIEDFGILETRAAPWAQNTQFAYRILRPWRRARFKNAEIFNNQHAGHASYWQGFNVKI